MADFAHRLVPAVLDASARVTPDVPGGWLDHLAWEASFRWYFYGATRAVISTLQRALRASAQLPGDIPGMFTKLYIEMLGDAYVERGEWDMALQHYAGDAHVGPRFDDEDLTARVHVEGGVSESKRAALQALREAEAMWHASRRPPWMTVPRDVNALRAALENGPLKYLVAQLDEWNVMELRLFSHIHQHREGEFARDRCVTAGKMELNADGTVTFDGDSLYFGRQITKERMVRAQRFLQTTFPSMTFAFHGEYRSHEDPPRPCFGDMLPPF